jgi:capsular exopolysaccharide synthesis family protein
MMPLKRAEKKYPLLTSMNPQSQFVEELKSLRTQLNFTKGKELRSIMLTSVLPGEGKSLLALNLAVAYTQEGKRVVIVDANLRKPVMHHTLTISNGFGLTDLLQGRCMIEDALNETQVEGLQFIPAGLIVSNPVELLASSVMSTIMNELHSRFDMVIFDSPAALRITDAQVLASITDGVLMVVRSRKVKGKMLEKVKESLELVNARILGAVLNRIGQPNEAFSYYYG